MRADGIYLRSEFSFTSLNTKARLGWVVNLFMLSSMEEMPMTSWPELGQEPDG